jgi:uncharacterized protein YdeI (YjbR/CyaY-like superfamily)
MGTTDPRVDAYIERSEDFARPILTHLREVVHEACPEVEEAIKWGFPNFLYRGMMCSMASFKRHCAFGFWKESLVLGERARSAEGMGQFGRLESLADLPPRDELIGHIHKAMRLNEEGVKAPQPKTSRKEIAVPEYFAEALRRSGDAWERFQAFSPSHRRECVEWLEEAKRASTRERRIATAVEWIAEGKPRNWKYIR